MSYRWFGTEKSRWPVVPIRKVCRLGTGHTPDRSNPDYWREGECVIPWVTVADIHRLTGLGLTPIQDTEQHISEIGLVNSAAVLHPPGTVMVSRTASIGFACRIGRHMATTQAFVTWTPGPAVDSRYLLLIAKALAPEFDRLAYGSTHLTIYMPDVEAITMPLPPLTVQKMIAGYLDRETARFDALISAKQRMIELLRERWNERRRHAVTSGLAPDALVKSVNDATGKDGPSWLGSIPRTWRLARLKFLARMESGHTPNRQVDAYWVDCTIPWITLNDVSDLENSWRFHDPKNAINELGLRNSSAQVLPAGAVAMSRDATVGRAALLGRPMAVSQHFVAWICGDELLPEYLLNVIRGPMQHLFGSLTAGATIATIGMPDLNQLVVPVPPLGEQARIAERIAEVEDVSRKTINTLRRQILLLQERRHALITAAVTGQLEIPEAV